MTNRIPLKAKYTGSDTTSLGEFESTDTIDNSYLNTGTAASQLVVLDASARLPAISGANLTDLPATGATTAQANAITANTAKVTNSTSATDLTSGTLADARFPATLPAVDGSLLTGISSGGASDINGLTDGYNVGNSVGLGTDALANDDGTTNKNTAVGTDALKHNTTGSQNSANGYKALNNNTTGGNNNANGYTALSSNTIGSYNTATGTFALASNTTGNRNTATGVFALGNSNGSQNTASGFYALMYNTGSRNTASGYKALENNTYGTRNIGIGNGAGDAITTGSNNTVIGDLAGTTAMASTVLIAAGTTERLKIDSTGLYVNGSATALGGAASPLVKTANYTASSGDIIVAGAGSITITLPSSPSVGDSVIIKDGTGAASTTSFTVNGGGANIASAATALTFNLDWNEIRMVYINTTIGWSI